MAHRTAPEPSHRHNAQQIRHQRLRHIRRRYRMVERLWYGGVPTSLMPGHFAKWNTSCNCWMCNKQNWPDTRPHIVGADLDLKESLLEMVTTDDDCPRQGADGAVTLDELERKCREAIAENRGRILGAVVFLEMPGQWCARQQELWDGGPVGMIVKQSDEAHIIVAYGAGYLLGHIEQRRAEEAGTH